jgi:hypothetical protein
MLTKGNAQGTEVKVVYVLRKPECRDAFLDLMAALQTATADLMICAGAKTSDYSLTERADRVGWFVESIRFANEKEHCRFDDLYCEDRRTSAVQELLDELVDSSRSDYLVIRRTPPREG